VRLHVEQRTFRVMLLCVATLTSAQSVSQIRPSDDAIDSQVRDLPVISHQRVLYASLFAQSNPEQSAAKQQRPGTIIGTILDQTGAVSVGARVRLTREGQSLSQEVVSGNNGQFSFPNVPPGRFQLAITSSGFGSQRFSGNLNAGQAFLVPPIVMAIAKAETEVRVGVDDVQVAQEQIKEQEKQRVFDLIPNFYVSYVPDAAPLTAKQKFELGWKVAKDPISLVGVGALAGFQQAANDIPGYGQGAQGYAKRYGAAYANAFAGIFIGNAILPSLLKQDPRYFYKGTGSTRSRILYAMASSVVCKGDNKRWQPNYSGILGSLAVGGISNIYYPPGDRNGAGLVFQNALIRIAQGSFGAIFQEFVLPKLTPRFKQKNPQPQP
jgi:Carboxypeptidase regulatory-like domain